MPCKASRSSSFAVSIGISLAFALLLIVLAFAGLLDDVVLYTILGGAIAANAVLIPSSIPCRGCFRS